MTYQQASELLAKNGQEQVLRFWKVLPEPARKALLEQIASLDFKEIARCKAVLEEAGTVSGEAKAEPVAPQVHELAGVARERAERAGEEELKAGRVGVILVAGGQGSRLGFDGPKGAFPIGPISGATLFYFHARKVLALTRRYGRRVPFYIMTSAANYAATVEHFKKYGYFGLDPKDVIFFKQGMWPGMTSAGKIILDAPGHIFMSPDGHGGMISALKANGCLADMKKRGVKSLFFFQVDNPMVEIADPVFIGLHVLEQSEYSLKLCAKRSPKEGLGMVVKRGERFDMIEYTEMTDEMNNRRTPDGELYFKYGSPAIHVFDRAFLEREAAKDMPLHLAHKKIPVVNEEGRVVKPDFPNGWKFEKFIFDCLGDAERVSCMAFDRREEFSPVKNADGKDSPATCRDDLQSKWRRMLETVGVGVSRQIPLELDPAFALDAKDVTRKGLLLRG